MSRLPCLGNLLRSDEHDRLPRQGSRHQKWSGTAPDEPATIAVPGAKNQTAFSQFIAATSAKRELSLCVVKVIDVKSADSDQGI